MSVAWGLQDLSAGSGAADNGDDGVDADCGAFRNLDFGEDAGHGRRNFGIDLVGGDLEEGLVFFDVIAGQRGDGATHVHGGVGRRRASPPTAVDPSRSCPACTRAAG